MNGFTQIPNHIIGDERLSATAFRVLIALASHAEYGNPKMVNVFPSYARLRKLTGIGSDVTISKALQELEGFGYIKWNQGRTGRANYYTFGAAWYKPFKTSTENVEVGDETSTENVVSHYRNCRPPRTITENHAASELDARSAEKGECEEEDFDEGLKAFLERCNAEYAEIERREIEGRR